MASKRYHAFISHASVDLASARVICDTLESRGLRCWIAPRDIAVGQNYGRSIVQGVRESGTLVLVLSAAANASSAVHSEVEYAFDSKVPCLVIRLEAVAPSEELRFFTGARQHVDAFDGDLAAAAERLAQGVRALSPEIAEPAPSAAPPPSLAAEPASDAGPGETAEPAAGAAPILDVQPSEPAPSPAMVVDRSAEAAVRPRKLPIAVMAMGALGIAAVIALVTFGQGLLGRSPANAPSSGENAASTAGAASPQAAPSASVQSRQTQEGARSGDLVAENCITSADGRLRNACAYAVTVVFCGGSTRSAAPSCFPLNRPVPGPVIEVPANGSGADDAVVEGEQAWTFSCRSPALPIAVAADDWDCAAPTTAPY